MPVEYGVRPVSPWVTMTFSGYTENFMRHLGHRRFHARPWLCTPIPVRAPRRESAYGCLLVARHHGDAPAAADVPCAVCSTQDHADTGRPTVPIGFVLLSADLRQSDHISRHLDALGVVPLSKCFLAIDMNGIFSSGTMFLMDFVRFHSDFPG